MLPYAIYISVVSTTLFSSPLSFMVDFIKRPFPGKLSLSFSCVIEINSTYLRVAVMIRDDAHKAPSVC